MDTKDILIIILPIASAILGSWLTYFFAMRKYRQESIIKFKEEKYSNMLSSIKGFQHGTVSGKLKEKFIDEKHKSWLYA